MTFSIWVEGFPGPPQLINYVEAESFQAACDKYFTKVRQLSWGRYDSKQLTIRGCRLFDNEHVAQKGYDDARDPQM